jgi:hypothetical protein
MRIGLPIRLHVLVVCQQTGLFPEGTPSVNLARHGRTICTIKRVLLFPLEIGVPQFQIIMIRLQLIK